MLRLTHVLIQVQYIAKSAIRRRPVLAPMPNIDPGWIEGVVASRASSTEK
jgi:hypothetical protein